MAQPYDVATPDGFPLSEMLTVCGHRVRVDVEGAPAAGGVPLLLVNGIGAPIELWRPLRRSLGGQTIAFDAPGTGESPPSAWPLRMREQAAIAAGVLDALGVDIADVLGFSYGGMVAQEFAVAYRDRLRRLVLASTACGWGGIPGSPVAVSILGLPHRNYSAQLFGALAPYYVGGAESRDRRFLAEQGRLRARHPPSSRGYLYQWTAAASWSSLPWLRRLTAPTLVLTGSADPLVPAGNARILAQKIRGSTVHVMPDGGHLCLLQRAPEAAVVVNRFLSR